MWLTLITSFAPFCLLGGLVRLWWALLQAELHGVRHIQRVLRALFHFLQRHLNFSSTGYSSARPAVLLSGENKRFVFDTWAFKNYELIHTFALEFLIKKVQNCHLHNAATSKVGFEFSNLQSILKRAEVWPVEPMKWATKRDSRYESTILNFPNLKIKRHSIGWAIHLLNGEYFVTICQGSWRPLWSRYLRFWITAN